MLISITGTKVDLREDKQMIDSLKEEDKKPIEQEEGEKLAKSIEAVKYLECSALTQQGLNQVLPFQV